MIEFDGVIVKSDERGSGAFVFFPFDLEKTFGTKGQVKIKCEFDGAPYKGSIVNMGGGPCIGVLKVIREQLGKQAGDTVHVKLWKDEEPRIVEVPEELQEAFKGNPREQEVFEKLSYSHKREYVQWIESAKRAETRSERIRKTIQMLGNGIKSPKV